MNVIDEYRSSLLSQLKIHKMSKFRSEEEIIDQFNLAVEEIELENPTTAVMYDYFGQPKDYLDQLLEEMDNKEQPQGILTRITQDLRDREPITVSNPWIQGVLLVIIGFFVNDIIRTIFVVLFNFYDFPFFYLDLLYPIIGESVSIVGSFIEYSPYFLEIFAVITSIHLFSKKHQLWIRNLVRVLLFIGEMSLIFDITVRTNFPGSGFDGIFPSLLLYEVVVYFREHYIDPMGDRIIHNSKYNFYIALVLVYSVMINFTIIRL